MNVLSAHPHRSGPQASFEVAPASQDSYRLATRVSRMAWVAGSCGIDFLDPSAVRAANRHLLLKAAQSALLHLSRREPQPVSCPISV